MADRVDDEMEVQPSTLREARKGVSSENLIKEARSLVGCF